MGRKLAILCAVAFAAGVLPARAANIPQAYAGLRPAIVRVWAFDAKGTPIKTGTGIVVASDRDGSVVLTAAHVVAGAASLKVDVDRARHDLRVTAIAKAVELDLALLRISAVGLKAVTFATRDVAEGDTVAIAGYPGTSTTDDVVAAGLAQEPRLLYPGIVSSVLQSGRILEVADVDVELGMSGGPVFDPATGEVAGIVEARLPDRHTGVAVSGPSVVLAFLHAQHVRVATRPLAVAVQVSRTPAPVAVRAPPPVRVTPAPVQQIPVLPPPVIERTPHPELPRREVAVLPPSRASFGCSQRTLARVSDDGGLVTTSDGASYRISNSYMKFRAADWTTGDAVMVCVSHLDDGQSAASIENPERDFKADAAPIGTGNTLRSNLVCRSLTIARVAGEGATVTTSDGASYHVSTSYMRFRASDWTTGDHVQVCAAGFASGSTAASIENPARLFKLQAELVGQTTSSSTVSCRGLRVFRVSGDGGTVTTSDGVSYVVVTSYMRFRAADWTTGDPVTVCSSHLGDGSISASIENPARFFKIEATRR